MKVLQFIPSLGKGGAERMFVDLANKLVTSGCNVQVLLAFQTPAELNQSRLNIDIPVSVMGTSSKSRLMRCFAIARWAIMNKEKLKQFDVIHMHLNDGLVLGLITKVIFFLVKRNERPRLVFTCHMVGMAVPKVSVAINALGIFIFDQFVLMAINDFWKSRIGEKRFSNVCVISNGIDFNDTQDLSGIPMELSAQKSCFQIGSLSRLEPERRPNLFIDLFSIIHCSPTMGSCRFILGGDGSMKFSVQELANSYNLSKFIDFKGLIINSTNFLKDIDIYISLNVGNQSGIAALEAVFQGVPVIGIQLDEKYSVQESDFIWSSSDLSAVAEKVIQLHQDKGLLNQVRSRQHTIAREKYTAQVMAQNYLETYNTLVDAT